MFGFFYRTYDEGKPILIINGGPGMNSNGDLKSLHSNYRRIIKRSFMINGEPEDQLWEDMERIGFDCNLQLKAFTNPVLIIQGKQDILKEETAIKSQKAFKNSKLVLLDHCGHYGWLDAPVEYFSAIETFLHPY